MNYKCKSLCELHCARLLDTDLNNVKLSFIFRSFKMYISIKLICIINLEIKYSKCFMNVLHRIT